MSPIAVSVTAPAALAEPPSGVASGLVPPVSPAAMTQRLLRLADEARDWHGMLLRTSTELLAMTDLNVQAGYDADGTGPVVGVGAVRARLGALLESGGAASWLRTGPELSPAGPGDEVDPDPDPVASLLLGRVGDVDALISADSLPSNVAADARWASSGAAIRVADPGPRRRSERYDLVLIEGQPALTVWSDGAGQLWADTVAEPVVVELLRLSWETVWAQAVPLDSALRLREVAQDETKRAVLEHLQAGEKDEVIARALGVSLRTCRKHIAELFVAAGAVSRFQAGARFGRAGLLGGRRP
jgi:hypothetical protein